jgi:CubicO group peptidase (beta-lactamase class C family)
VSGIDSARRRSDNLLLAEQRTHRLPAIAAAVMRDGEQVWCGGVGREGVPGDRPDADTQFRLGSITKTFTAVAVMQLRDAGRLGLDDPLSAHLPETQHGSATIRRLLCHLSGLQREPVGEVWDTMDLPDREEMLRGLEQAEAVLPPGRRWHYSNLAYAVLGEVVARLEKAPWEDVVSERILQPLGMTRTTFEAQQPAASGWLVDPYADRLLPEPDMRCEGISSAAQMWSTPADLGRWAAFLADPDPRVLTAKTVEEMTHVEAMADLQGWMLGWGLGLMLFRRGDRVLVGHGGAMPGFLAGLMVHRPSKIGAVAFTNNTSHGAMEEVAGRLVEIWVEHAPLPEEPWAPGAPVPPDAEGLLGRWWSEGTEFVVSWRAGSLEARIADAPSARPPAVFRPDGTDRWRTESGREQGELLRVVRDESGAVVKLYWATYAFTRDARPFGTS